MVERDEEMNRMREYAMKNVDSDNDSKVSLGKKAFIVLTKRSRPGHAPSHSSQLNLPTSLFVKPVINF